VACKVCFFYRLRLRGIGDLSGHLRKLALSRVLFEASEAARLRRIERGSRVGAQAEHIEDSKAVHRRCVGKILPGHRRYLTFVRAESRR
jgi:hypothetical protein